MARIRKSICVFTGSSPGADPRYRTAATAFAKEMVARDYGLVFGGGKVGLMRTIADAVLAGGGHPTSVGGWIGIRPEPG
ncbi:MAG: hypothetical protein IH936_12440 [Acidobacteria bacterium]|nr:hypothetical protein [Acidobacteriota bacterium]